MMTRLLYLLAGLAAIPPVVVALGWAVWGAGVFLSEYLSLLGSIILVASAFPRIPGRQAARMALLGAVFVWSFYLPVAWAAAKIAWTNQELHLAVFRWTPSSAPLAIEDRGLLSPSEIQQIKQTGIKGVLSAHGGGNYGSGKHSRAVLIIQRPVGGPVELNQPDAVSVIYIQEDNGWTMLPSDARTLKRTIRIAPEHDDPGRSLVYVELASGALEGFDVWWPKNAGKRPGR